MLGRKRRGIVHTADRLGSQRGGPAAGHKSKLFLSNEESGRRPMRPMLLALVWGTRSNGSQSLYAAPVAREASVSLLGLSIVHASSRFALFVSFLLFFFFSLFLLPSLGFPLFSLFLGYFFPSYLILYF